MAAAVLSPAMAQDLLSQGRSSFRDPSDPAIAHDALVGAPSTTGGGITGPGPFSGPTATAEIMLEPTPNAAPVPAAATEPPATLVDQIHGGVSTGLLNTAVWLDSFFGDERHLAESNESHFKLRFAPLFEDSSWTNARPDYELRLVLPQMRRKTRLVISGDMWSDGGATDPAGRPLDSVIHPENRDVTTSLQLVLPSHTRHSTTVRGGFRYHDGKFILYIGPRYRYLLPIGVWTARFTENLIWETAQGWESRTRIDMERSMQKDLFFRASTEGVWTEGVTGYLYSVSFLLRQPLDRTRAVQYEWNNLFQTRPVDALTEVILIFRYRQQIWRRWLFLEIAPQYRFPRDRGFEATPGIMFMVEMLFGRDRR
jgi:hypothetical protein